ncbi:ubiquitin protein ligase E3C [Cricetulus griseus]
MPFTLEELILLSRCLRDACLGIIKLAYPETKPEVREEYVTAFQSIGVTTNSEMQQCIQMEQKRWVQLFKVITNLVKMLKSRDTRRNFCPPNHWLSEQEDIKADKVTQLYVPASRHVWRFRRMGRIGPLQSTLEVGLESPPLSVSEERQLAILTELPFVVPFEERVKALYENMLVELPFAGFFLSKLLGTSADVDIHHLASLDPEVYKNLLFLKSYEEDVEELGLNFTVVNNDLGEAQVVELKFGGKDIPVTGANRIAYIHLVADYRLNKQIRPHCLAFRQGLANVVSLEWLRMFDQQEIQELYPAFCIHNGGSDLERLPTASTCMNLLKLPEFYDEALLRSKLLYAIECAAGFELS